MLTAKQERFCQEYVIDSNGTQAAIRAGYSEKAAKEEGSRLLTNANIQNRLNELQKDVAARLGLTHQWVFERFKAISDRSMQAEAVLDRYGKPTGEFVYDSSGANKATEMIGKMLGAFESDNNQKNKTFNVNLPK